MILKLTELDEILITILWFRLKAGKGQFKRTCAEAVRKLLCFLLEDVAQDGAEWHSGIYIADQVTGLSPNWFN